MASATQAAGLKGLWPCRVGLATNAGEVFYSGVMGDGERPGSRREAQ
ncbi:hypothetical protein G4Y79_15135 [Phototrophicus methaneseepsis]|uniref:Uncharacterized protein n=1 Tax=Phototrophicus methaneseepsis TaxID=2710758 RepID=A0A7S8E626_9CHLR|nr:hypothetical protein [Phototrophicus methaneseepsis]QPC81036.1 hypothetical protein G4Y79_15135 [Phototrophicus methaneseepsis]